MSNKVTNGKGTTMSPTTDDDDANTELATALDQINEGLGVLTTHSDMLEETAAKQAEVFAKRRELAAVEAETAQLQAAWDKAKRGLTQAQYDQLANWDQNIFARRAELAELQQALPKAEATLAAVNKALAAADATHKKLESHIETFKREGAKL
jgi:chromosome segregation ATPase